MASRVSSDPHGGSGLSYGDPSACIRYLYERLLQLDQTMHERTHISARLQIVLVKGELHKKGSGIIL
jgi:hypothetical protein